MLSVKEHGGALVSGASPTTGEDMARTQKAPAAAKVVRGVYVRGEPKGEGAILRLNGNPHSTDEITPMEYWTLLGANYVVAATDADLAPPPKAKAAKADV